MSAASSPSTSHATEAILYVVFERFTDGARRIVVLAQEEVRTLRHEHIGTEHLLLALIHAGDRDEEIAPEVL